MKIDTAQLYSAIVNASLAPDGLEVEIAAELQVKALIAIAMQLERIAETLEDELKNVDESIEHFAAAFETANDLNSVGLDELPEPPTPPEGPLQ